MAGIAIKLDHGPKFLAENDVRTSTYKTVLTNAAVSAAHDNISDLTEIAGANGYTTGGVSAGALTVDAAGHMIAAQVTLAASGGSLVYRSIYLARVSDGALFPVAWDEGSSVTILNGASRVLPFSQTNGVALAS